MLQACLVRKRTHLLAVSAEESSRAGIALGAVGIPKLHKLLAEAGPQLAHALQQPAALLGAWCRVCRENAIGARDCCPTSTQVPFIPLMCSMLSRRERDFESAQSVQCKPRAALRALAPGATHRWRGHHRQKRRAAGLPGSCPRQRPWDRSRQTLGRSHTSSHLQPGNCGRQEGIWGQMEAARGERWLVVIQRSCHGADLGLHIMR